jgi:hypothetical protein
MHEISVRMTEFGSGSINWKRIFARRAKAGIQRCLVEQDQLKSPFDSIHSRYAYLLKP